ncbi:MAG: Cof-type HAD-IIB family hydrolase [Alistipes sp.]|uniref:Cof-type HAD-IIB family hydrolase n=1 Tax=Alistipes sp. TaxID=1872444 RepID=UPI001DD2002C|nr:Cof-type HAD-IIB family hydrolase [Alistipes sp.]MBS5018654.1 Cof-type HAD-IIB family hydrolase [Alistipes sp.]
MKKALFLDVDGTLISFKTHEVPASALAALREAHARGVRLFIATGRAAADLDELGEIPYDGVAALNGADCLMRDGRVVARHPISRSDFERAMQLADRYGFSLAFELNEGLFVNRLSPGAEEWARMVAHPMPVETNLYELFDNAECCQMCFFFDPETQRRVMAELPSLVATRWCPVFADINVRGVDKATGMAEFAAHFGFAHDETMAFGDGGNDVAMLRAAGVGVAMGNACDEALAAADYITASVDDDGIRRALEHFGVIDKR